MTIFTLEKSTFSATFAAAARAASEVLEAFLSASRNFIVGIVRTSLYISLLYPTNACFSYFFVIASRTYSTDSNVVSAILSRSCSPFSHIFHAIFLLLPHHVLYLQLPASSCTYQPSLRQQLDYFQLPHNTCPLYILPILPIIHFLFPAMSYTFRIYKISMLLPRN